MKEIIVFALGCFAFVSTDLPIRNSIPHTFKIADRETLEHQLTILELFKSRNMSELHHGKSSTSYSGNDITLSTNVWIVKLLQLELLEKREIFSVFNQQHLEQAIYLFKAFYYARSTKEFYQLARAARSLVNEEMWKYSLSVALVHRPDTFGTILPPIYEISPYYFFNNEILNQAEEYWRRCEMDSKAENITIFDDPLNRYAISDSEQILAYFTEDVGLNAFYYYYHISYPFWMDGKEFGLTADHRGEFFYYVMAQLVARYDLERLSNGMDEVSSIDFTAPLDFDYYPSLRYPNGVEFPSRSAGVRLAENKKNALSINSNLANSYTRLRDVAFRIQNVVDLGRAYSAVNIYDEGADGLEILSNLLEGNPSSPELSYYGNLQIYARHVLGNAPEALNRNKAIPAATEHYETTLRDPVSWRFFKWLLNFYKDFFKHLRPYSKNELEFPGVKINSVHTDELVTYFDHFDTDVSDHLNPHTKIYLRQNRLNHSPFKYNISILSNRSEPALVKVFLGPKYDRFGQVLNITENTEKFYVLDYFTFKLVRGSNLIIRNMSSTIDRTSYNKLFHNVEAALHTGKPFVINGSEAYWAFPERLIFPKGTVGGMEFQLYVIFIKSPAPSVTEERIYKRLGTGRHSGNMTLRYPLDRMIDQSSFFVLNSFLTDITIRHDSKIKHL